MVNCSNLIIKMSPRFVLGRENVPCVAEVVNRSLKADCTDFTVCHIRTLNMLKTSKLGLISWTKDKQVKANGRVPNSTVNRHPGSE